MAQKPQRIIEVAVIDRVGPITAERLMAMSEAEWGLLRQRITDARRERSHRSIAACLRCGGAVFIKARAFRQKRLPYFAHFKGADAACPWFTGDTQDPDSLKAGQYHGHQESPAHRLICEQIAHRRRASPKGAGAGRGQSGAGGGCDLAGDPRLAARSFRWGAAATAGDSWRSSGLGEVEHRPSGLLLRMIPPA